MKNTCEDEAPKLEKKDVRLMKYFCIIFLALFIGFILIPIIFRVWNINDFFMILVISLVWMVPALATNATMVIFGKGGSPIDGGRCWRGKRLLGNGKTWQGSGCCHLQDSGSQGGIDEAHEKGA